MTPWFLATEKFDPADPAWKNYVTWSKLTQLDELVTVDGGLCPTLLPKSKPEYRNRIVSEAYMLDFFTDGDFLRGLVANIQRKNFLCVVRNPSEHPASQIPSGFTFLGYDLADIQGSTSALSNCGGFPNAFSNTELSDQGLLASFDRAKQVQSDRLRLHPHSAHANCHLWAIFRHRRNVQTVSDAASRRGIAVGLGRRAHEIREVCATRPAVR